MQKETIYFFSCSDAAQPTLFIELVIKQYFLSNFLERIMSENFNEANMLHPYPNSIDGVYTSLYFSTLSLSMIVQEFEDYLMKNSNCSKWALSSEPDDDELQCRQEYQDAEENPRTPLLIIYE